MIPSFIGFLTDKNKTMLRIVLLISSSALSILAAPYVQPVDCKTSIVRLQQIVDGNYFGVERGLDTYIRFHLGSALVEFLEKATPSSHWIDMGAGDVRAMRTLAKMADPYWGQNYDRFSDQMYQVLRRETQPKMTAVTLKTREKDVKDNPEKGFRILKGRKLEEISNEELKKADLITDVFGILSYSSDPGATLQKYVDLLKPGGQILVYLGTSGKENTVSVDGNEVSLREWIQAIPGLVVEPLGEKLWNNTDWDLGFRIRVAPSQRPQIPKTRLIKIPNDREQSPVLKYEQVR